MTPHDAALAWALAVAACFLCFLMGVLVRGKYHDKNNRSGLSVSARDKLIEKIRSKLDSRCGDEICHNGLVFMDEFDAAVEEVRGKKKL